MHRIPMPAESRLETISKTAVSDIKPYQRDPPPTQDETSNEVKSFRTYFNETKSKWPMMITEL
jgi:hypothetical protein